MNDWKPTTISEASRLLTENASGPRQKVIPVGGRTSPNIATDGIPLSTVALDRIIDFPARDMTITVEAGIRIEALQEALAAEGQQLPIDIPTSHRATLGGAIANNVSGPRRFGYGTFRDYLIGMSAVDGTGRLFSAGGRVVKNVAGYDLCKLMIGSEGTLAVLVQVTLKTRPLPACEGGVWFGFDQGTAVEQALETLLHSETRPVIEDLFNQIAIQQLQPAIKQLEVTPWGLCVGFAGSQREVEWQVQKVSEELAPLAPVSTWMFQNEDAKTVRDVLTEYQATSDDPVSFSASLPPSRLLEFFELATSQNVALQGHAGDGIVIGHVPDSCTEMPKAIELIDSLRGFVTPHCGQLRIISCDAEWYGQMDLFGTQAPYWHQMQKIKNVLDPWNLLRGQFQIPAR